MHVRLQEELGPGCWPPLQHAERCYTPDRVCLHPTLEYIRDLWEFSPVGTAVGPGEKRRKRVDGSDIRLFPAAVYWDSGTHAAEWSVAGTDTHHWRFDNLRDAVDVLCPHYGVAAFFSVKNRPSLLVTQPPMVYSAGRYHVQLAAPVGLILADHAPFSKGMLCAVIYKKRGVFGVVKVGTPSVVSIPKSKVEIVCPMIVTYDIHTENLSIRFRRSILDHYAFYP